MEKIFLKILCNKKKMIEITIFIKKYLSIIRILFFKQMIIEFFFLNFHINIHALILKLFFSERHFRF